MRPPTSQACEIPAATAPCGSSEAAAGGAEGSSCVLGALLASLLPPGAASSALGGDPVILLAESFATHLERLRAEFPPPPDWLDGAEGAWSPEQLEQARDVYEEEAPQMHDRLAVLEDGARAV